MLSALRRFLGRLLGYEQELANMRALLRNYHLTPPGQLASYGSLEALFEETLRRWLPASMDYEIRKVHGGEPGRIVVEVKLP